MNVDSVVESKLHAACEFKSISGIFVERLYYSVTLLCIEKDLDLENFVQIKKNFFPNVLVRYWKIRESIEKIFVLL
jgi:hypothetical protein